MFGKNNNSVLISNENHIPNDSSIMFKYLDFFSFLINCERLYRMVKKSNRKCSIPGECIPFHK